MSSGPCAALPLGVLEQFASAPDRWAYVDRLMPGSEERYICVMMLAEQSGYPDDLMKELADGADTSYGRRWHASFLARKQLITLDPAAGGDALKQTLNWLQRELSVSHYHSREVMDDSDADAGLLTVLPPDARSVMETPAAIASALKGMYMPSYINSTLVQGSGADCSPVTWEYVMANPDAMRALLEEGGVPVTWSATQLVSALTMLSAAQEGAFASNVRNIIRNRVLTGQPLGALYALADAFPSWRSEPEWLTAVLGRLAPPAFTDFVTDTHALDAYLAEVAKLASGAGSAFAALQLAVQYHQLKRLDTGANAFTAPAVRDALLAYMRLPRMNAPWVSHSMVYDRADGGVDIRKYDVTCQLPGSAGGRPRGGIASALAAAFALPFPSVEEDASLVRDVLLQRFAAGCDDAERTPATPHAPWNDVAHAPYLANLAAIAKLTRGTDAERANGAKWLTALTGGASDLSALQSSAFIKLASWNASTLRPADAVALSLWVKGVERVSARVFEINTSAYYQSEDRDVEPDVSLDGLVPHETHELDFQALARAAGVTWTPMLELAHTLPLPSLGTPAAPRRGVFIVDFVGAGMNARALVCKGALRFLERRTVAGHALTLLDEDNAPLPLHRASVMVGGRRYVAEPGATDIIVPYAATSAKRSLLISLAASRSERGSGEAKEAEAEAEAEEDSTWSFCTRVGGWEHASEWYTLESRFYVDRESLLRDNYNASLLLRPRLLLHGAVSVPLKALESVELAIQSTDGQGASSTKNIRPFTLSAGSAGETVVPFAVPPQVRALTFTLRAQVEIMNDGRKERLSCEHSVSCNGVEGSANTRAAFLRATSAGVALFLLGKCGEPIAHTRASITFHHAAVDTTWSHTLKTDAHGCIQLGALPRGVCSLSVSAPDVAADLALPGDVVDTPTWAVSTAAQPSASQHVQAAVPFRLPRGAAALERAHVSLVEYRPLPNTLMTGRCPLPAEGGSLAGFLPCTDMLAGELGVRAHVEYDAVLGMLLVRGLPAGVYSLAMGVPYEGAHARPPPLTLVVMPSAGARYEAGHLLARNAAAETRAAAAVRVRGGGDDAAAAHLLLSPAAPLQIASIALDRAAPGAAASATSTDATCVCVRVSGGSAGAAPATGADVRVHLLATVFQPAWRAGTALGSLTRAAPGTCVWYPARSRYLAQRALPEEIQYVLNRQAVVASDEPPLAGSLLPRPSLLANERSQGVVTTSVQAAGEGGAFNTSDAYLVQDRLRRADLGGGGGGRGGGGRAAAADADSARNGEYCTYDFLPSPTAVLCNLRPDEEGTVRVPLADVLATWRAATGGGGGDEAGSGAPRAWRGGELMLTALAVDSTSLAASTSPLPVGGDAPHAHALPPARNLGKLVGGDALDAEAHFMQTARITPLGGAGAHIDLSAASTQTAAEVYYNLSQAYDLMVSLSASAQLQTEWSWLVGWSALPPREQRTKYSKYACHELHLFLFFKDYAFFKAVVAPALRCKRAKTFVDHWLLGHALDAYHAPAAFAQLNRVEKALLAMRAGSVEEARAMAQLQRDEVSQAVNELTRAQFERLFRAGMAAAALSSTAPDANALKSLLERAQQEQKTAAAAATAAARAQMESASRSMQDSLDRSAASLDELCMSCAPTVNAGAVDELMLMADAMPVERFQAPVMQARGGAGMLLAKSSARASSAMPAPSVAPSGGAAMWGALGGMPPPPAPGGRAEASKRKKALAPRATFRRADKEVNREMAEEEAVRCVDDGEGGVTEDDEDAGGAWGGGGSAEAAAEDVDMRRRAGAREAALYRPLDKTEEYAETHYHRIHLRRDDAGLVQASPMWADFAEYAARIRGALTDARDMDALAAAVAASPFVSAYWAAPAMNLRSSATLLNELLLSLAVIGFAPLASAQPPSVAVMHGGAAIRYTAGANPVVVFHEELEKGEGELSPAILCAQSLFDPAEQYVITRGQRKERFLPVAPPEPGAPVPRIKLQTGRVYGASVVITNTMSRDLSVSVLHALPYGALPVSNSLPLKSTALRLGSYSTQRLQYLFYMPFDGCAAWYPAQVSCNGKLLAAAPAVEVETSSRRLTASTTSWRWIAHMGSVEEVVAYLTTCNMASTDVSAVAWRCRDKAAYDAIMRVLCARLVYHPTLWGYALLHADIPRVRQLLDTQQSRSLLRGQLGLFPSLRSALLTVTPERGRAAEDDESGGSGGAALSCTALCGGWPGMEYEHLEYKPLINARAHQLGTKRSIQTQAVSRQYTSLLTDIATSAVGALTRAQKLAFTYFLLLQDQVRHAKRVFSGITPPAGSVGDRSAGRARDPLRHAATESKGEGEGEGKGEDEDEAVPPARAPAVASTASLQYDYMAGYLDVFEEEREEAEAEEREGGARFAVALHVAAKYDAYPVPKWAALFRQLGAEVRAALAEMQPARAGGATASPAASGEVAGEDEGASPTDASHHEEGVSRELVREGMLSRAHAQGATLSFTATRDELILSYTHITTALVRIYCMDIELLFSRSPFTLAQSADQVKSAGGGGSGGGSGGGGGLGQFAFVRPNATLTIALPAKPGGRVGELRVPLPEAYRRANVMLEVVAPQTGARQVTPRFSARMKVSVAEAYGRLTVLDADTGAPVPRAYVKVYGRMPGSEAGRFFKDGYTSHAGAFDYMSLSTDAGDKVTALALCIISDSHGACVKVARPPTR